MKKILLKLAAVAVACGLLLSATVVAVAVPLSWLDQAGSGDVAELTLGNLEQRSYVYARDGATLSILRDEFNRQPIELKDIPEPVVNAILAVEDAGFWLHDGINMRGMMRALGTNLDEGAVAQGGSTITQQLVKLEFSDPTKRTLDRKVQEMVLASRMEAQMTKEEILTRYLNKVWFGNHAYGIQAAAETYFGKSPKDLNLGEAALLAGLIRNPNTNNPFRFPEDAKNRRLDALRRMEDAGVITADELKYFDLVPMPTAKQRLAPLTEDYFAAAVRDELLQAEWLGKDKDEREQAINRGGMRIYTTLDPRAHQLALEARNNVLPPNGLFSLSETDPKTGQPYQATAGIVTIEQSTGAVRAMVGGPGFDKYEFNLVTQNKRNTGSAAKTFVLASLMEQGYSPNDIVDGTSPCSFKLPGQRKPYTVDEGSARSIIDTITTMTTKSVNCAYVRLGQIAGIDKVVDLMGRLGITGLDPNIAATPLGGQSVRPIDMAAAYAGIANDGVFNPWYIIERVEAVNGEVLYQHTPSPRQAISPQAARLTTRILEQNVQHGTGTNASLGGRPAAGKTGTASNNDDVWFVGYTGQLTTAVWIGAMGKVVSLGSTQFGGKYPARIWGALMRPLHEGLPVVDFPNPEATRAGKFLRLPPSLDLNGAQEPKPPEGDPTGNPGQGPPTTHNPPGRPDQTVPPGTNPTWPTVTPPSIPTPTTTPQEEPEEALQREAAVAEGPPQRSPPAPAPAYEPEPSYPTYDTLAPAPPPYG